MKDARDNPSIAVTFQLSLDAFLEESHPEKSHNQQAYEKALKKLEEARTIRSPHKKQKIAQEAIEICSDCIEAYLVQGLYAENIWKQISLYREGMELATMNLGKDYFLRTDINNFFNCPECKSLFHIKYAYACTLFEAGYMRKAQQQFIEIYNLNPSDNFHVKHYILTCHLYFEEFEKCYEFIERYKDESTFMLYTIFLYQMKNNEEQIAQHMIPQLKQANTHLYQILTYEEMNTCSVYTDMKPGSIEEAGYTYRILSKVIHTMEYIHIFLTQ